MTIDVQAINLTSAEPFSLTFENSSGELRRTNYWDSEPAKQGAFYVSINSGLYRLLVPDIQVVALAEMKTGKSALIEQSRVLEGCYDIVFDDGTETPYALTIPPEMFDRVNRGEANTELLVYTRAGLQFELPCKVSM